MKTQALTLRMQA